MKTNKPIFWGKLRWITVIAAILYGTCLYASPYVAILKCKRSIERKDSGNLDKCIDYKLLRANLKARFKKFIIKGLGDNTTESPYITLGMLIIVNPLADGMVNAIIRPSNLQALLNYGKLNLRNKEISATEHPQNFVLGNDLRKIEPRLFYNSYRQFTLSIHPSQLNEPIEFLWRRTNLVTWKLHDIHIPHRLYLK
ncbi:DUF2939 domain-containing protein [Prochlorococcus sp. MIT 1300]|uniref:DUF2939 domain-containing protein n=1 Tax=Prochlorococcus sp. MIT 1300 TaxID=3096218 RepID=UPI002A754668|nr:DUF2939 domain-containing protein [Prochlorococcus sp. MIT 1300]